MSSVEQAVGSVTDKPGGGAASSSNRAAQRRRTGVSSASGSATGSRKGGESRYTYVYEARRPLLVGDTVIDIGEIVPGAEDWPRVESWVRTGKIVRRRIRAA